MEARQHLQIAIEKIEQKVLRLSARIDETLISGMTVLMTKDSQLAQEIIEKDKEIDEFQKDLEDSCAQIVATDQPVATDLRCLIASIKVAAALERIGDYIRHMCLNIDSTSHTLLDQHISILQEMMQLCSRMMKAAIDAFITRDKYLALETSKLDKNIDMLYHSLYKDVVSGIATNTSDIEAIISFLNTIRFIERTGDIIANISEYAIYVATGEHLDL